ncbi:sn-glycerol-3-phosphate-binding periplasmic protein UgpB [bioreactor metagenome]|jgi:sn-glycerol 3-phosphate transport system substrate-binding protein|uniref:sn-glycerol-3-phosphate-binding periplasmic protein UgpB n=1 Tax=bioreactor metagenome TaxID=1076179 RepID=A0A644WXT3_9ZZZZ
MRKSMNIVVLLVMLLVSTTMVWGAGAKEAAKPEGPIKILYWRSLTGVAGDAQDEIVRRFNESRSDIIVESQFQGTYAEILQKLQAALAAGDVPDLVLLDSPHLQIFAKDGVLVNLDSFVAKEPKGFLEDYMPGLLADSYYNKSLYSLPALRSTPLLYINEDMLAEAGLPRRAPATWDEFREYCKKLTKVNAAGETTQYGVGFTMGATTAHWYFQGAVYAFDGKISDENFKIHLTEAPAVAAAKLWQDMVFIDKSAVPSVSHDDLFNKKVAMVFGSTGSMGNVMNRATFKVLPAFIPGQVRNGVPVGGAVIAMPSTDTWRQWAAWEFMKFFTGTDSQAYLAEKTGYMPNSLSASKHPDLVKYYAANPQWKVAIDQLKYVQPQASVISFPKGTEILRQMAEKLLIANMDVNRVMAETKAELEKEYNENFK